MSSLFMMDKLPLMNRLLGYGRFLGRLGMTMVVSAAARQVRTVEVDAYGGENRNTFTPLRTARTRIIVNPRIRPETGGGAVAGWIMVPSKETTMEKRWKESPEELLRRDHYQPEELALLLDMDVNLIRHAAFAGDLKAHIVEHHIVSITREAVLRWLDER